MFEAICILSCLTAIVAFGLTIALCLTTKDIEKLQNTVNILHQVASIHNEEMQSITDEIQKLKDKSTSIALDTEENVNTLADYLATPINRNESSIMNLQATVEEQQAQLFGLHVEADCTELSLSNLQAQIRTVMNTMEANEATRLHTARCDRGQIRKELYGIHVILSALSEEADAVNARRLLAESAIKELDENLDICFDTVQDHYRQIEATNRRIAATNLNLRNLATIFNQHTKREDWAKIS